MPRPELGGAPSERAANLDYVRADRAQELVDLGVGPMLQGPDDHFGVDGGRHQNLIARGKVRSERRDGSLVFGVGGVKERDDDVGVERYSRHSPRKSSRYPSG